LRSGGGHAKGSAWEREVGKRLSLWLTNNQRPDIFSRNVLSGGSFTITAQQGKMSSRMPGDLMAAHPLAFNFLSKYSIECKHLASLGLEQFIYDSRGSSILYQINSLADGQAQAIGCRYLLIAKQNHKAPLLMCGARTGQLIMDCFTLAANNSRRGVIMPRHLIVNRWWFIMALDDFLRINPDDFLKV